MARIEARSSTGSRSTHVPCSLTSVGASPPARSRSAAAKAASISALPIAGGATSVPRTSAGTVITPSPSAVMVGSPTPRRQPCMAAMMPPQPFTSRPVARPTSEIVMPLIPHGQPPVRRLTLSPVMMKPG